jgi:hypothetical protein
MWWYTSVVLATQEVWIGGSQTEAGPEQKQELPSEKITKSKKAYVCG